MPFPDSIESAPLLARGTTADVYAWGVGHVLKLFRECTPFHANEVAATRVAHAAGLPVPDVIDGLIEVGGQQGIVFERIDGPTMVEYIDEHPAEAEICAQQAAELHAQIHSTQVLELIPLMQILTWSIQQAGPLDNRTRQAVLDVLHRLPTEEALCHSDFYPHNIIVSARGPIVIDWAIGARGSAIGDHARTWLISKLWLGDSEEKQACVHMKPVWRRFWTTYFRRYRQLHPFASEIFSHWQIVAATVTLAWERDRPPTDRQVSFIEAALNGKEHPWLSGTGTCA